MTKQDVSEQGLSAIPPKVLDVAGTTTVLDASDNSLTEVPASIGDFANLEELLLFKNKIKTVAKEIGGLKNLTTLNLFNNLCTKVPPEIGNLGALEELNLAANKMMMMTDAHFSGLSSLKILTLNDNRLIRMGSLANLANLEELRLYGNNLEEMPAIGKMPALKCIELHKNRIPSIPDAFFTNTPALERFLMNNNQLTTVPATIVDCKSLTSLQLQENQLESLPEGKWPASLETLFVQDNPKLAALPAGLKDCKTLKRCNIGKSGPDALADALKNMVIKNGSTAMFWGKDGVVQNGS